MTEAKKKFNLEKVKERIQQIEQEEKRIMKNLEEKVKRANGGGSK
jgi:uncharacterized protein (UPF0335 family)